MNRDCEHFCLLHIIFALLLAYHVDSANGKSGEGPADVGQDFSYVAVHYALTDRKYDVIGLVSDIDDLVTRASKHVLRGFERRVQGITLGGRAGYEAQTIIDVYLPNQGYGDEIRQLAAARKTNQYLVRSFKKIASTYRDAASVLRKICAAESAYAEAVAADIREADYKACSFKKR